MSQLRATERTLDDTKYLKQEHIEALFPVIKSIRDRAMFRLIYHRGLRASEPGMLELADWDGIEGSLFVRREKGSRSSRYLLIPAEEKAMRAWIKVRGTAAGPLFLSRNHGAIERTQVWRLMQRYCKLAGIPPQLAHPHALKHSCGTHLYDKGTDLLTIQDWLGHRNIQNTKIYVDPSGKAREQATAKLRDWK